MGSDTVSGPELKTILQGLGVPPSVFADRVGVTMRTVVRWFDADAVPARAVTQLDEISAHTLLEMSRVLTDAQRDGIVRTYRTDKDLGNGLPASWHRALAFRVVDQLRVDGTPVRVQYRRSTAAPHGLRHCPAAAAPESQARR